MRDTTSKDIAELKQEILADPRIPKSLQKLYFKGSAFKEDVEEELMQMINEHRENIDLPYDELYHEQKRVI